jgi:gamma-glutamyltranspeptidase
MTNYVTTTRPVTMGREAMISTPHYLASFAGARIMLHGGNAVDAAVAANAVLNVVCPNNCSPGGDAFWLFYDAKNGRLRALNASGRSSYAASVSRFIDQGITRIPVRGMLPVTVPGTVDGWCSMLERFGTMKLSKLLEPAIHYAKNGFPVSGKLSNAIKDKTSVLSGYPTSSRVFLPNGRIPQPGDILIQEDLAKTFETIAAQGRNAFYNGAVSKSIVEFSAENGGLLSEEDFADHKSDWVEPLRTDYRDLDVCSFPPNSQGLTTLLELNIVEGFDPIALGQLSADLIHVLVEAKKLAFEDRDKYISDPEKVDIPVQKLLSKDYAASKRREINLEKATDQRSKGSLGNDTVYLCVVDKEGNGVSLNQSIYFSFGNGMVAGNTGILLQNRGAYFSLRNDSVNRLEPHKRTLHTLAPCMMLSDDKLRMAFGTMGGDGQPQTHLQLILDVVDFKTNVQEAIETPRWLHGSVTIEEPADVLSLEEGISSDVARDLEGRGHIVKFLSRWNHNFGHAQAISLNGNNNVRMGGADPRGDGIAIGW